MKLMLRRPSLGRPPRHHALSLRRLIWLAPDADVRLSIAPHASGLDKECRIELAAPDGGKVAVRSLARHWSTAVLTALTAARKAAVRLWRERAGVLLASPERHPLATAAVAARLPAQRGRFTWRRGRGQLSHYAGRGATAAPALRRLQ